MPRRLTPDQSEARNVDCLKALRAANRIDSPASTAQLRSQLSKQWAWENMTQILVYLARRELVKVFPGHFTVNGRPANGYAITDYGKAWLEDMLKHPQADWE